MPADQTATELTTRDVLLQLDHRVSLVEGDVRALRSDVAEIQTVVVGLQGDARGLQANMKDLRHGVNGVKLETSGLRADMSKVEGGLHAGMNELARGLHTTVNETAGGLRIEMNELRVELVKKIYSRFNILLTIMVGLHGGFAGLFVALIKI